jgi:uncharacterized alkaline shock family protein YloU
MDYQVNPSGKTTIAPEVLTTIARMTALSIAGVSRLSTTPSDVNQFFKRGFNVNEGVRIEIENDAVYADLYLILRSDVNAREVAHNVQSRVARAISEMVGMEVGKVNIHIEDIEYQTEAESSNL